MWTEIVALSVLPVLALCFSHQDNELFNLQRKIADDIGKNATFYSWLGLKSGASQKEITRAFRKLSRSLHPDRNPSQEATERFARLNQAYKTLNSPMKDRYDYYLSVGFPKYNPTLDTWMYSRYRPGLFFTVVLLALAYTCVQYLVLKTTAMRRRQHLAGLIRDVQVEAAKASKTGVVSSETRISLNNKGFVAHPTGEVYFEGTLLSPELVEEPTWKSTHAGRLYLFAQRKATSQQEVPSIVTKEYETEAESEAVELSSRLPVSASTESIKKGAARRRAVGPRGKSKIF